ncbi:SgcJ/EcaC family oxidoreductase (plasmid) [Streptomyces sp. NBC_01717]|uniref:SgcJ/EcaC family oxidoreductase n=1 Tax=Streptomyces sp. NBC_01717 TaxID=2975918 RepID=UPI002E36EB22|nr:SgcJ/EcaC family oxidoreductase [Streptomyces sp. NBC_01717]
MIPVAGNEGAQGAAVIMGHRTLEPFVSAALSAYETCTPEKPPSCFAVLVGELVKGEALVHGVEFGRNVRATELAATDEYRSTIVPRFGPAYDNEHRGFWCDSTDLLNISRKAEAQGWDILGSIHLHPDWHRIGPPAERGLTISEAPTPMDAYMISSTSWPVNMICYLERPNQDVHYTLAAWGPGAEPGDCVPIPIQFLINAEATPPPSDQAIPSIFADMVHAWSRADPEAFTRAFAPDADFTSVRSNHFRGSQEIAAAHSQLFKTVYAGTRLTATVQRVSNPRPDIAIAHVEFGLAHVDGRPARGLGGNPGHTMHAQAVLERRHGDWQIISFMNMVPLQPPPEPRSTGTAGEDLGMKTQTRGGSR